MNSVVAEGSSERVADLTVCNLTNFVQYMMTRCTRTAVDDPSTSPLI